MAKQFAEYARQRRASHGAKGHEAERVFRSAYAFGRVIYAARQARNLRQVDLAALSGVAQADISRIERGMIAPTVPTLIKLTDALNAQIEVVLAEPGESITETVSLRRAAAG